MKRKKETEYIACVKEENSVFKAKANDSCHSS